MSDLVMSDFFCYVLYCAPTGRCLISFISTPGLYPGLAYGGLSGLHKQTTNTLTCVAK